jgi:RNA polymerase sigma factor (sigma-70 family)
MELAKIVAEAKGGDAEAFTGLVRRYQLMVFGCAYADLGDVHLAEDAAQQAFITAYRSLGRLEQPERFGGWLRGIVRFECSHLRRGRRPAQVPIEAAAGLATSMPEPAQVVEEREALDRVLAAVNALPAAEREATVLFYIREHSQREVAAFLNVSVSTVNNRLRAARRRLKEGGLLPMAVDALKQHGLPEDFAERVGEIIRAQGLVFEARFAGGDRPPVLNALTVTNGDADAALTAEVAQYLGDDLVHCITVGTPDHGVVQPRSGMRVVDTASPIRVPLDGQMLSRVVASFRRPAIVPGLLETGIKAIDLFCPLPAAGLAGLAGDMQTGKMVIVEEIVHRFGSEFASLSILVFVETSTEVTAIPRLDYRTSAGVEAVYLPVADADPVALGRATSHLDAVMTLSRRLGEQMLYPAIDPLRSTSRLLDPAVVGREHYEVALGVRHLLEQAARMRAGEEPRDETVLRQAALIQRFLTQPFFVTEGFTNRPGRFVPREETVAGCEALLDGRYDELSEDALFMIGPLAEAL